MSEDSTPKDRPPVVVEIVRPQKSERQHPVTLETIRRSIEEHAQEDATNFGRVAAELAAVRNEQATKHDTKLQTRTLAIIIAAAAAIGQFLHSLLGL